MIEKVYCPPDFSGCSALQSNKADTENNPQTMKPRVVGNTVDNLHIMIKENHLNREVKANPHLAIISNINEYKNQGSRFEDLGRAVTDIIITIYGVR